MAIQKWTFDPVHTQVRFRVKHLLITGVNGRFTEYDIRVTTAGEDFTTANIEVDISVSSLNTDVETRDNHLRSADFFDAKKYPKITFVSTSLTPVSARLFKLKGDLTIRNVMKSIELDVEFGGKVTDAYGAEKAGFTIEYTLDRFDYDLKWNNLLNNGTAVVGKKVKITCDVQLVKLKSDAPENSEQTEYTQGLAAAELTHQSRLPDVQYLKSRLPNSFLFYAPKDVVGGDYYWFEEIDSKLVVVVADCVGHGMEGSLKAMMGAAFLDQIVSESNIDKPAVILGGLNDAILNSVRKSVTKNASMLTMEVGLFMLNLNDKTALYAGGGIPLAVLRANGELHFIPAYRQSVGSHTFNAADMTIHTLKLTSGDRVFMFSDGYRDQFGGGRQSKIGLKGVKTWISETASMNLKDTEAYLKNNFTDWKGSLDQIDDVTMLGVIL